MKRKAGIILLAIAIGAGIFGFLHQYILTGRWFDWSQFINQLNHETLILFCFVAAVSLVIGGRLK